MATLYTRQRQTDNYNSTHLIVWHDTINKEFSNKTLIEHITSAKLWKNAVACNAEMLSVLLIYCMV